MTEMTELKKDQFCNSLIFLDENEKHHSKYINGKPITIFENPTYDVDKMIGFVNNNIHLLAYNLRGNITKLVETLDSVKDELLLSMMDGIIVVKSGWQIINFKYTNNKCGKYILVDLDNFDIYNNCDYSQLFVAINDDLNRKMIKGVVAVALVITGIFTYEFFFLNK